MNERVAQLKSGHLMLIHPHTGLNFQEICNRNAVTGGAPAVDGWIGELVN